MWGRGLDRSEDRQRAASAQLMLTQRAVRARSSVALLAFLAAPGALAAQLGSEEDLLSVDVHGFVSPGFIYTTNQVNYLADSNRGSFEFTELGINFTKQLTDQLRLGLQLFAYQLGPNGDYRPSVDWFYLDYHFRDWLGLRAGRVKIPFGLYNEINDVDAARVSVLLPQAMYPETSTDFLLAQTGLELYGYKRLGAAGALEYRFYCGTIFIDTPEASPGVTWDSIRTPFIVGGRLLWETPLEGFRLGASVQDLRIDAVLSVSAPAPEVVSLQIPAALTAVSAEYASQSFLAAIEYGRWYVGANSSDPNFFPRTFIVSERGYAMASYRVNRWFWPGAYYAMYFPNVDDRASPSGKGHDLAGTLRFDINPHWLVKLEGHLMSGTAQLDPTLNGVQTLNGLPFWWAAFFVKTTAYF
jgi:hypothetical protein